MRRFLRRRFVAGAANEPDPEETGIPLPLVALLLGYLVLIAFTFRDYGITYDEWIQSRYGEMIIDWYRSGFTNREVLNLKDLRFYGGLFDAVAQAASRFSPFGLYETRHLLNALVGAVATVAVWCLGRRLAGDRTAFLAVVFLLLTPVWYGHTFNNPKDIPFAVGYVLTIDAMLATLPEFPRISWRRTLWLGCMLGATLAIRFGGVILLAPLGTMIFLWVAWRWRAEGRTSALRTHLRPLATRAVVVVGIAWFVMLPWWPSAQVEPLSHPLRTLQALGHFDWNYPVYFEGQHTLAPDLPWYYLPKWLALMLPEAVLVGLLAAGALPLIGFATRHFRRDEPRDRPGNEARVRKRMAWTALLVATLFPPLWAIGSGAVLYDGIRHFLFMIPLLAVLAAVGASQLLSLRGLRGFVIAGLMAATLAIPAVEMVRLHPYQYIWFNHALAGGVQRGADRYESDYWGVAYKEAAEWVVRTYANSTADNPLRVAACSIPIGTAYYLPRDRFRLVRVSERPAILLRGIRGNCPEVDTGTVVHRVERLGVTLVTVFEFHQEPADEDNPVGKT